MSDHSEIWLPTAGEIGTVNTLFQRMDALGRQRIEEGEDVTESDWFFVGHELGLPDDEIQAAMRVDQTWSAMAMEKYGRVGRDPARIDPFLAVLARVWNERSEMRFGELIASVTIKRWGRLAPSLLHPEDDVFLEALHHWDRETSRGRDGANADPTQHERRHTRESILRRIGETWKKEPDQRFGQFVGNTVRRERSLDALFTITDDTFLDFLMPPSIAQ